MQQVSKSVYNIIFLRDPKGINAYREKRVYDNHLEIDESNGHATVHVKIRQDKPDLYVRLETDGITTEEYLVHTNNVRTTLSLTELQINDENAARRYSIEVIKL